MCMRHWPTYFDGRDEINQSIEDLERICPKTLRQKTPLRLGFMAFVRLMSLTTSTPWAIREILHRRGFRKCPAAYAQTSRSPAYTGDIQAFLIIVQAAFDQHLLKLRWCTVEKSINCVDIPWYQKTVGKSCGLNCRIMNICIRNRCRALTMPWIRLNTLLRP